MQQVSIIPHSTKQEFNIHNELFIHTYFPIRWNIFQDMKKVQSQVDVEQENFIASRPTTSNRRLWEFKWRFWQCNPFKQEAFSEYEQLGSNSINSATQGISFIKERKGARKKDISPTQFHLSAKRWNRFSGINISRALVTFKLWKSILI